MRGRIAHAAAVAAGLLSCAAPAGRSVGPRAAVPVDHRAQVEPYYPLSVGRCWVFDAQRLGERRTHLVTIVSREGEFYRDSQGARLSLDRYGLRDDQRYLLRGPLEAGTTWTNVISATSVERYRIASVGAPCEAPAGQFDACVVVESKTRIKEDLALVNQLTFARGVGLVRVEVFTEAGGRRTPQSTLLLRGHGGRASEGERDTCVPER